MEREHTLHKRHRSLNDFTHIDFKSSFGDINFMNRNAYQHIIKKQILDNKEQQLRKDIPKQINNVNTLITYDSFDFETELTLNTEEHNKFGVKLKREAVSLSPKTITLTLKVLEQCNDINFIIENIRQIITDNMAALRQKAGIHLPHTARIKLTNNSEWFVSENSQRPNQTNLIDEYWLDAYPISVSTSKQTDKKFREIVIEFNCPKPAFYKERYIKGIKIRPKILGGETDVFFTNEGDIATDYQMMINLEGENLDLTKNKDYNYYRVAQICAYMPIKELAPPTISGRIKNKMYQSKIWQKKQFPLIFFDFNVKRKYGNQLFTKYIFQSIDGAQNYYGVDVNNSLPLAGYGDTRDDYYKNISHGKMFKQWWAFDISYLVSPTSHHINGFYKQLPPRTPMYISNIVDSNQNTHIDIWFNEYYLL